MLNIIKKKFIKLKDNIVAVDEKNTIETEYAEYDDKT